MIVNAFQCWSLETCITWVNQCQWRFLVANFANPLGLEAKPYIRFIRPAMRVASPPGSRFPTWHGDCLQHWCFAMMPAGMANFGMEVAQPQISSERPVHVGTKIVKFLPSRGHIQLDEGCAKFENMNGLLARICVFLFAMIWVIFCNKFCLHPQRGLYHGWHVLMAMPDRHLRIAERNTNTQIETCDNQIVNKPTNICQTHPCGREYYINKTCPNIHISNTALRSQPVMLNSKLPECRSIASVVFLFSRKVWP